MGPRLRGGERVLVVLLKLDFAVADVAACDCTFSPTHLLHFDILQQCKKQLNIQVGFLCCRS
jgi:hypothetical protein